MRSFLQGFAKIVIGFSLLIALLDIVAFFTDGPANVGIIAAVLGAALGLALVGGIVWLLADISEQIAELPEDLAEARSTSTRASDAETQRLPQQHASPSQVR